MNHIEELDVPAVALAIRPIPTPTSSAERDHNTPRNTHTTNTALESTVRLEPPLDDTAKPTLKITTAVW